MSVRVVLAVVLAAALLGATQPALDDARQTRSERLVRGELAQLRADVATLRATSEPVPVGERGARRVLTLDLPRRSPASAPVESVTIGGGDGSTGSRLTYRIAGGPERTMELSGIDLLVARRTNDGRAVAPTGRPLVLEEGGRHRLVLELVRLDGQEAVLVSEFDTEV